MISRQSRYSRVAPCRPQGATVLIGVFRDAKKGVRVGMIRDNMKERRGQKGAAMVMALILMFFGSLVVGGLLSFLQVSMTSQAKAQDRAEAKYSAEAGVQALMSDLSIGDTFNVDNYPWSRDPVNGHTPTIDITSKDDSHSDYTDYIVSSTADNTTLTYKLRQTYLWMNEACVEILWITQ